MSTRIKCPSCSCQIDQEDMFCGECGAKLSETSSETALVVGLWFFPGTSTTVSFKEDGRCVFTGEDFGKDLEEYIKKDLGDSLDSVFGQAVSYGKWELIGPRLLFDDSGFSLYEVKIQGNEMIGTGRHIKGKFKGMQFETLLTRVVADGLTDLELLSDVTSEEEIDSSYSALMKQGLQLFFLLGDNDSLIEAKKIFSHAVKINPERPDAFVGLGICCNQLGKDKAAISHIENALNKGFDRDSLYEPLRFEFLPDESEMDEYELGFEVLIFYRAISYFNMDNVDQAKQDIDSIYDNLPEEYDVEKNVLCAKIFLEHDDLDNAQLYLGKALVADPVDTDAHLVQGLILFEKGYEEEAVMAFTRIIDQQPKNSDALLLRANIYKILGETAKKMSDIKQLRQMIADGSEDVALSEELDVLLSE